MPRTPTVAILFRTAPFPGGRSKLNDTVIGKLGDDGKTFAFTYEQPKIGVSGSGSLKIYTSRIMGGKVTADQDGQTIQWTGRL